LIDWKGEHDFIEGEQVRAARDAVAVVPGLLFMDRENRGTMRAGHPQVMLSLTPSEIHATAPQAFDISGQG
jgi:hypothetical protein